MVVSWLFYLHYNPLWKNHNSLLAYSKLIWAERHDKIILITQIQCQVGTGIIFVTFVSNHPELRWGFWTVYRVVLSCFLVKNWVRKYWTHSYTTPVGCPSGSGCGLSKESNQNKISDDLSFSTKIWRKSVGPALHCQFWLHEAGFLKIFQLLKKQFYFNVIHESVWPLDVPDRYLFIYGR